MRTTNALKRANITTIGQILSLSDNDLLHLRNFGTKSLDELKDALAANGYAIRSDKSARTSTRTCRTTRTPNSNRLAHDRARVSK